MIQSGTIHFGVGAETTAPDRPWTLHLAHGEVGESGVTRLEDDFRSADLSFPLRFGGIPRVVLSLAGIVALMPPAGPGFNVVQVNLDAEDVQPEEFNIRIRTATNAQLGDVWVTWIAHDEA